MNATTNAVPAALLDTLGVALAAASVAGPAWADDYFVRQWETADKEIIKID